MGEGTGTVVWMEPSEAGSRRIGRYHLSEPVGGGPTGEVFRAKIHGVAGLDRQFAIKRVHASLLADPEHSEALSSALRLYGGLEHPRIARLHEHKLEGSAPYIAVEWCAGIDLARLVDATFGQGRPLPSGAATSLVSRAARAVGYAHGRGQTHLGLSPTNLLCSPSGEVKVTDFGLLPARLGASPADDSTLLGRLPYLAPEQFADEKCSPATDVFVFGALFYELLSGTKAFVGRGGHDIAAAVHAAKPTMDAIPKPLARILMRCLAHSPFERYPSGGALADAIDAAARGMLMRGDQRDAAKAVQEAKERLETMRRTQASGALSFPMPAPPRNRPGLNAGSPSALGVPNLELDERVNENATTDVMMPKPPAVAKPAPMPGHARVPAPDPGLAKTMMGSGPPNRLPSLTAPVVGAPRSPAAAVFDDAQPTTDFKRVGLDNTVGATLGAKAVDKAFSHGNNFDDRLGQQTVPFSRPDEAVESTDGSEDLATRPAAPKRSGANFADPAHDSSIYPSVAPDSTHPSTNTDTDDSVEAVPLTESSGPAAIGSGLLIKEPTSKRTLLLAAIGVGAIAVVVLAIMIVKDGGESKDKVAEGPTEDASTNSVRIVPAKDAGSARQSADAQTMTPTTVRDAGNKPPTTADAAPTKTNGSNGSNGSNDLVVTSKPSKATVYLDGTRIGKTPITVDSGSDSHKLVVIRAGYKLYVAETDGGETVNVELEEVIPSGGRAGIKVRCKDKNRYYVFVDGLDVGQLCPTERIGVEMGPHTVEIYDPVTDARRRFEINVTQTRLSSRVRVD